MTHKVEIKICGMTQEDDVRRADELGVDYVGFVLYPGSPRHVSAAQLVRLLDRVRPACRVVGVFVNEARQTVEKVAADARLFAVQIHGDERPEDFAGMKLPIWRAVRLSEGLVPEMAGRSDGGRHRGGKGLPPSRPVREMNSDDGGVVEGANPLAPDVLHTGATRPWDGWVAERYVLDTAVSGSYGGTGVKGNWVAAAEFSRVHRTMLAGGLQGGNVADAIRTVRPFGVDVASGVESKPGRKDHAEMEKFVKAVRAIEAENR